MIVLSCPWCEQETPVELTSFNNEFQCERCGTWAVLAEDPEPSIALAA